MSRPRTNLGNCAVAAPGRVVVALEDGGRIKRPPRVAVGLWDGKQTLILDGFPTVSQVRLLGPNGGVGNRYGVSALRQRVKERTAIEAKAQRLRPMRPPVRVTLRYVFSDARQRDEDNFAIVGKPVIDGLVRARILAGDDAARLAERVEFAVERRARRLEILLEEVG